MWIVMSVKFENVEVVKYIGGFYSGVKIVLTPLPCPVEVNILGGLTED